MFEAMGLWVALLGDFRLGQTRKISQIKSDQLAIWDQIDFEANIFGLK